MSGFQNLSAPNPLNAMMSVDYFKRFSMQSAANALAFGVLNSFELITFGGDDSQAMTWGKLGAAFAATNEVVTPMTTGGQGPLGRKDFIGFFDNAVSNAAALGVLEIAGLDAFIGNFIGSANLFNFSDNTMRSLITGVTMSVIKSIRDVLRQLVASGSLPQQTQFVLRPVSSFV